MNTTPILGSYSGSFRETPAASEADNFFIHSDDEPAEEPTEVLLQEAEDWLLQETAEAQAELPAANRWQRRRQTLQTACLGEESTS